MNIISNWMNTNELRSYPLEENHSTGIPDDLISDMQVFVSFPRSENIDDSYETTTSSSIDFSGEDAPYVSSAAVTRYMATVVVKCRNCSLFCTKSLDDIVPGAPIEFVSENGLATGWISFGDFDKSKQFRFQHQPGTKSGLLDRRAVVAIPSITIGGVLTDVYSSKLTGDISIVGGAGVSVSANKENNEIEISLNPEVASVYSDPCLAVNYEKSTPAISRLNGVKPENGSIVLAFTGEKLNYGSDVYNEMMSKLQSVGGTSVINLDIVAVRKPIEDCVDDYIKVTVSGAAGKYFRIAGYRIVYDITDAYNLGFQPRDLEFSIYSGYHMPEYDVWTPNEFLPSLAELYRSISSYGASVEDPYSPHLDLSNLRNNSDSGPVTFLHRIRNFLSTVPTTDKSSIKVNSVFVEVAYVEMSSDGRDIEDTSFLKKTILFSTDPNYEWEYPENHNYEKNYISSNRYSPEGVIRPITN